MWYFSWVLGTAFACSFAVLFGIWYEFKSEKAKQSASLSSD